jgi:hypothetical protein
MFDYYEPVPAPVCPWCDAPFKEWQGKDGPNALFVWRQGDSNPIDQPVVEESRIGPSEYLRYRLPDLFRITDWCVNAHQTEGIGRSADGAWRTFDLDEDGVRRAAEQRERDRIQRLRDS